MPPVRPDPRTVAGLVRQALCEDIGVGDITTRLTVPARLRATAGVVARQDGIVAGIDVCRAVFRAVDRRLRFQVSCPDGKACRRGDVLAVVSGAARSILTAERTALNFLQRLSGIATLTRRYVDAVSGTRVKVLDTRKTTPGWRQLEKYAVRCGGGVNHRRGLDDMVLIKDNHIAAAGSVAAALARCRGARLPVEIEVKNLDQLEEALEHGAVRVLLDNMTPATLRRAVALVCGRARLEASGRITLSRARRIAGTGVDAISVGALTHSAPSADIALDFVSLGRP